MDNSLSHIVEALLYSSSKPLTLDKLLELTDAPDKESLLEAISALEKRLVGSVIVLKNLALGYRFQVKQSYSHWVLRLFSEKPAKYSRAILETLAIIAYRQPVTRADVEAIRGVSVSTTVMRTLVDRGWVKVAGHRDVPGKPAIYITTKAFLDYFNLSRLDELPSMASFEVSEDKALADSKILTTELESEEVSFDENTTNYLDAAEISVQKVSNVDETPVDDIKVVKKEINPLTRETLVENE